MQFIKLFTFITKVHPCDCIVKLNNTICDCCTDQNKMVKSVGYRFLTGLVIALTLANFIQAVRSVSKKVYELLIVYLKFIVVKYFTADVNVLNFIII